MFGSFYAVLSLIQCVKERKTTTAATLPEEVAESVPLPFKEKKRKKENIGFAAKTRAFRNVTSVFWDVLNILIFFVLIHFSLIVSPTTPETQKKKRYSKREQSELACDPWQWVAKTGKWQVAPPCPASLGSGGGLSFAVCHFFCT